MKIFSGALAVVLAIVAIATGCKDSRQGTVSTPQTSSANGAQDFPPFLTNAQPRLQTMKLYLGSVELTAELALKPTEIYTGMMWRTNMADGDGMLFVFADATPRAFYMKNCYVPLSIAYIDPEGVIQEIHDLHPLVEASVPSVSDNIQFTLEVPQGWFKRRNIVPGTVVRTPHGDLKKTFTFRSLKQL